MAAEDRLTKKGWTSANAADHQNKPTSARRHRLARQFRRRTCSLQVTKEKNGILLVIWSRATSALTGKACSPNTIQWADDTYAIVNATGERGESVRRRKHAFFITGTAPWAIKQSDTSAVVEANGGKVFGGVNVPINTPDFSSYLLQARHRKPRLSRSPTPAAI